LNLFSLLCLISNLPPPTPPSFVWYGKDGSTHSIAANVYAFDLGSGTCLLRAFSMSGDFMGAVKVLKDMLMWKEKGGIKFDGMAWKVAKEIMEDMKRGGKGRLLDKVAVTTIINGLVSKGKVKEAMGVFELRW
jgi:pentatricopeptide repeat protein